MHTAFAALMIAARLAHEVHPPQTAAGPAAVVVADQAPVPVPHPTFDQEPARRGPLVLFPPRRPLVLVQPPPRPAIIKVQTGNKGLLIGGIIGAGFGAALGATAPHRADITRSGSTLLGSFVFGALGAGLGHVFDFQYLHPGTCGCR